MKFRNGFVTNSSSSSFVIAYRANVEIDEETEKRYPFVKLYPELINSLIDATDYCDTRVADVFTTQEEYEKYLTDQYGWQGHTLKDILEDDEDRRNEYEEVSQYLSQGYSIMIKRISNSDCGLESFVKTMAKDNDSFILIEEGGY